MKRKRRNELQRLAKVLGIDAYTSSFLDIASQVETLHDNKRKTLVSLCEDALSDRRGRSQEQVRVAAVKVLVALFPITWKNIASWLKRDSERSLYEVHFSLFCFLDQVPQLKGASGFEFRVPELVENYLKEVKAESAHAAWMAGDLLGDHWEAETALSVLSKTSQRAQFAAGRLGAIHGLSHLLSRLKSPKRIATLQLLRLISENDRSKKVRDSAKLVLEHSPENQTF